ncbi:MAG: hypothetical protein ACON5B_07350 [Myxococcota bacterium]
MIIVAHRRNTLEDLRTTPVQLGVEFDVREVHGVLEVTHDPFTRGVPLETWLDAYQHGLLVVNVKAEGLAPVVQAHLRSRGVTTYVFLDQSMPELVRMVESGERRCMVRISRHEPLSGMLTLASQVDWCWLDVFGGQLPLAADDLSKLRATGVKICLVSPELHGLSHDVVDELQRTMKQLAFVPDAVCTREVGLWEALRENSATS